MWPLSFGVCHPNLIRSIYFIYLLDSNQFASLFFCSTSSSFTVLSCSLLFSNVCILHVCVSYFLLNKAMSE